MATLRELVVKISANSTSFQTEIARASRMGADYYKTMENGGRRAAAASRENQRALSELNNQLSSVRSAASGMAGAFAGVFATSQLISFADTWTQLNSRLKLASTSTDEFAQNQRALMDISQRTGTSLEANTNMFSRMSKSMQQLGYTAKDTAKVTELVATSLRLSGAGAGESASVITQFGQAMASGVLRGDEFNSIMENGGRFAQALADGLGVTVGQLRQMAMAGQLSTDKVMPALLSQLDKVRQEGESMGATVSASVQRVENAFLAWVGSTNEAFGATNALAGVLDSLASNIDGVANVASVLVGLGLARYFGGLVSSVGSAAAAVVRTTAAEIAANAAQVEGTKVAVARARAAVFRAQQAKAAAVGIEAQIVAERQLAAAQTGLTNAIGARSGAIAQLGQSAGLMSRMGSGLMGLLGGWPGLILAAGGAMFALYEHTQQVHKEAVDFGNTIDDVRLKMKDMSSTQLSATSNKADESLKAQMEDLDKLDAKIREVQANQRGLANIKSQFDESPLLAQVNNLMTLEGLQERQKAADRELIDLEAQREGMASRVVATQKLVNDASDAAAKKAVEQAGSVGMLAGAYAQLNRQMGVTANAKPPQYAGPVIATQNLNPQQQKALDQSFRAKTLAGLDEKSRQHQQNLYSAQDAGLEGAALNKYVQNMDAANEATRAATAAKKEHNAATRAGHKEATAAAKLADEYTRKMSDLTLAIEVQKVRAKDGQKEADLYAASHQNGAKWTEEQIKALRKSSEELERWTQKADAAVRKQREQEEALKNLAEATKRITQETTASANLRGQGSKARDYQSQLDELQRVFDKTDQGAKATAEHQKAIDALNAKFAESAAAAADWRAGISSAYSDWIDSASNYAEQAGAATKDALDGMVNNITEALNGNKASWADWSISVLKSIEKILVNAALVQGLQALGGAMGGGSGIMGSIGSFFSGIGSKNGNVFGSGISGFSNTVVSSPTFFAFANGAGLMGEAGPEAVMPLTRGANGRLGVSANGGSGGIVINSTVNVNGDSSDSKTSGSNDAVGRAYQQTIDQSIQEGIRRELKPGGMIWGAQQKR